MKLESLNKDYDRLQKKYGDETLHSIYNGGETNNPDICFVFMNPTGRNIASQPNWTGPYYPWLGTKNIWDLFYKIDLLDQEISTEIKNLKPEEWTPSFCEKIYDNLKSHKIFITNLGKCTQKDARPLNNSSFKEYIPLLEKEINIIKPKIVILFGNQVSSLILNQKISVSSMRKKYLTKSIQNKNYKFFPVYYPVGNGIFNIDKAIEDIKWIINTYLDKEPK